MKHTLARAPPMTSRKFVRDGSFGAARSAVPALNETGHGRRAGRGRKAELLVERRCARGAPGDFIGLHGGAKAFEVARVQFHARSGQSGIVAPQLLVSCQAYENAAPAR